MLGRFTLGICHASGLGLVMRDVGHERKMTMIRTVFVGIACGVIGLLVGSMLVRQDRSQLSTTTEATQPSNAILANSGPEFPSPERRTPPDAVPRPSQTDSEIASLRLRIAELTERNKILEASRPSVGTPRFLDSATLSIPKRLVRSLSLAVIADDYGVTQDVVDVLTITEMERKYVEDALLAARAQLDALEIAHSSVVSRSQTEVALSIAPFDKGGEEVKAKLIGSIHAILGDERFALFMHFARQQLDEHFNHFGQAKQAVTVAREEDGRLRVDSNFRIETPTGTSSGGRFQTYAKDKIPENFQHLFQSP